MSDSQKRLVLAFAGLLLILVCLAAVVSSVILARTVIFSNLVTDASGGSDRNETDDRSLSEQGLLIVAIDPDGPAAKAGLRRGNIILRADGTRVDRPQQLRRVLQALGPGATFTLQVLDGTEIRERSVTLGTQDTSLAIRVVGGREQVADPEAPARPSDVDATRTPLVPEPSFPERLPSNPLPLLLRPVVVRVVEGSPAAAAGLQVGDVITNIDDKAILNSQELIETVGDYSPGDRVNLLVRRNRETLSLQITLAARPEDPSRGFLGVDLNSELFTIPNQLDTPTE